MAVEERLIKLEMRQEALIASMQGLLAIQTAIRDMIVRGAPAIGVAAAMGIALGVKQSAAPDVASLRNEFGQICRTMGETRPTAVNLFWAIRRMQQKFESVAQQGVHQVKITLVEEAQQMRPFLRRTDPSQREDGRMNHAGVGVVEAVADVVAGGGQPQHAGRPGGGLLG